MGRELEIIVEFFFVMFNNNEFLDVCFKFFNEIVEEKCVLKVYKLIFVIWSLVFKVMFYGIL